MSRLAALTLLALTACASHDSPEDVKIMRLGEPGSRPIVTLETRDYRVRVHGGDGPAAHRYTVSRKAGEIVAAKIDRDELARRFPWLAAHLESALAKGWVSEEELYAGL